VEDEEKEPGDGVAKRSAEPNGKGKPTNGDQHEVETLG